MARAGAARWDLGALAERRRRAAPHKLPRVAWEQCKQGTREGAVSHRLFITWLAQADASGWLLSGWQLHALVAIWQWTVTRRRHGRPADRWCPLRVHVSAMQGCLAPPPMQQHRSRQLEC